MNTILSKDICELSPEEIKALKLHEFVKLEHPGENRSNCMYYTPAKPQQDDPEVYYPIVIYANKHSQAVIDYSEPFNTHNECIAFCKEKNSALGHDKPSMFMLLESIRLEELLRWKLKLDGVLRINSDYTIREAAGFKYILYDKGNGILTTSSIINALEHGLAAVKRERDISTKTESTPIKEVKNHLTRRNQDW